MPDRARRSSPHKQRGKTRRTEHVIAGCTGGGGGRKKVLGRPPGETGSWGKVFRGEGRKTVVGREVLGRPPGETDSRCKVFRGARIGELPSDAGFGCDIAIGRLPFDDFSIRP
jgi:hypothetical protein